MSQSLSSQRANARAAARERRKKRNERRRVLLESVAFGHAYETIADLAGLSVSSVKRQVRRAIASRPPEPAETFVALQRQRLNRALQFADEALERGDMRAIAALVALTPQLERYWGFQTSLQNARDDAGGAHVLAPNPLKALETQTQFPPAAAPSGAATAVPEEGSRKGVEDGGFHPARAAARPVAPHHTSATE